MSYLVKTAKKAKQFLKNSPLFADRSRIHYVRRIERVCTAERVVALTFDDGPCALPAVPNADGRALSDCILDALETYHAKGTFDVIGDTAENYPDVKGRDGTAAWGGVRYDHYPAFGEDAHGGAVHCPTILSRMIQNGHQITNHSYRHILYGKKNLIYGKRHHFSSADAVRDDLQALHGLLDGTHRYQMSMARPPHYVDQIERGITSYDVYAELGYQYLGASFDGGGWLPMADIREETEAMIAPIKQKLEHDPDFFCGQIIFQKDGCNMMRRTPVAHALPAQLELLSSYGYRVVTVEELLSCSAFADADPHAELTQKCKVLAQKSAVAFTDNTLRLSQPMTWGALALLLTERCAFVADYIAAKRKEPSLTHARHAMRLCVQKGILPIENENAPIEISRLPSAFFASVKDNTRKSVLDALK